MVPNGIDGILNSTLCIHMVALVWELGITFSEHVDLGRCVS